MADHKVKVLYYKGSEYVCVKIPCYVCGLGLSEAKGNANKNNNP